jgi:hypothetical protein
MRTMGLVLGVFTAILVFARVPAHAGPCFDWSCSGTASRACTFDASCSTASPFVYGYDFNFGDGSDTSLTGNAMWSHSYSSGYDATVSLTIYFWSGSSRASVSCDVIYDTLPFSPKPPSSGRCQ